jgi:hypothetical protein
VQVGLAPPAPQIPFEEDRMSLFGIVRFRAIPRVILRHSATVLALTALLVLPGCWVTSINALYEDGFLSSKDPDVVFDQSLIGSWSEIGDKCPAPLTITAKDGVYDLQSTGKGEGCSDSLSPSHYQARLVKLDAYYFLDISPIADDVCDMCIARHNIFLAKFDKATLSIIPIDSDWLKKAIAAKTVSLATMPDDSDTLVASSKDLKAFCRKYAGDKGVFRPDSTDADTFMRK